MTDSEHRTLSPLPTTASSSSPHSSVTAATTGGTTTTTTTTTTATTSLAITTGDNDHRSEENPGYTDTTPGVKDDANDSALAVKPNATEDATDTTTTAATTTTTTTTTTKKKLRPVLHLADLKGWSKAEKIAWQASMDYSTTEEPPLTAISSLPRKRKAKKRGDGGRA